MATTPLPNTEQPSLVSPAVDPSTNNDSIQVLSDTDISRLNSQFQNEIVTANLTANVIIANSLIGQANVQIAQQISDSQNTSASIALAFSIALG